MSTRLAYWTTTILLISFTVVEICNMILGAGLRAWTIDTGALLLAAVTLLQMKAAEHVERNLRGRLAGAIDRAETAEAELQRVRRLYNSGPGWPA